MIAAGLCLMGGCFAQDAATRTVETYWPAHSVHLVDRVLIFKEYGPDLLMPFHAQGLLAGGCAENVLEPTVAAVHLFNWGDWRDGYGDAIYVGVSPSKAFISDVLPAPEPAEVNFPISYPVRTFQVSVNSLGCALFSEQGETYRKFTDELYPYRKEWKIRVSCLGSECDFVSYWWINEEIQKQYFMSQPMCSVAGDSAFFTHGFNILTEL